MNFAKSANEVQLWSVIPYAVAAVLTGKPHISPSNYRFSYLHILTFPFLLVFSLCRVPLRPSQTAWRSHAFLPPNRYNRIRRDRQYQQPKGPVWNDFYDGDRHVRKCAVHFGLDVEQFSRSL